MHRIDNSTRLIDGNGAGKDGFTEGNPGTVAATRVTDDWLNDSQEEVCNVIERTGLTLVKGDQDQLSESLSRLFRDITLSNWTKQTPANAAHDFTGSATNGNITCLVTFNGDIEYTYDGLNWTSVTLGSNLFSIAYGNGYWVAVGNAGALYYTTDPTGAWTSNTQGSGQLLTVAYGNGYWVAAGSLGILYYRATNPVGTWTSNTQAGGNAIFAIAYGNGYWVAACYYATTNLFYKATDPTGAWTSNTQGTQSLYAVAYGDIKGVGTWIVGGTLGTIYTKLSIPSGAWTFRVGASSATIHGLIMANDFAVVVFNISVSLKGIETTYDGITFTNRPNTTAEDLTAIIYAHNLFIAAGTNGEIHTSLRLGIY